MPITIMPASTIRQVVRRFQWNLSWKIETTVSIREMEDVSAAKSTSRKKTVPITPPIGMLLNTFGRVMNIRLGPALSWD